MTLAVEIMGRHSNIILVDQDGLVVDAIKRVDPDMSSVRPCPARPSVFAAADGSRTAGFDPL